MFGYLGCLFTHWLASWLVFLIELVMGLHMSCVAAHPRPHTHTGFPLSLSLYAVFGLCMFVQCWYISILWFLFHLATQNLSFVSVKCSPQIFQTPTIWKGIFRGDKTAAFSCLTSLKKSIDGSPGGFLFQSFMGLRFASKTPFFRAHKKRKNDSCPSLAICYKQCHLRFKKDRSALQYV